MLHYLSIENNIQLLCTFFATVFLLWYLYYLHCFTYWKKKGVPSLPPKFPAGHITNSLIGKENLYLILANLYTDLKSKGHKHGGIYFFNGPVYYPIDPEIIKSILVTDFEHFVDRGMYLDEKNCPLSTHLFSLTGQKWKALRHKLSPVFSSGKLKSMYEIFLKTTEILIEAIEPEAIKEAEVNIKQWSSHFTADIIASTALGLETHNLKNPFTTLTKIIGKILDPSLWLMLKAFVLEGAQNPGKLVRALHDDDEVHQFFVNLVKDTMKHRDENNIVRNDLFSVLLQIRDKEGLTFNEMMAQCFIFFLGAYETSSQTISFILHELAHDQDIQDKVRAEIYTNLGKDFKNYTYDDILKLPYLDKVFKETLRLHPVLGTLNRICVKPYKVPGTNVIIEEDTPVLIPVLGLQHDPDYFVEPLKFDPERFNDDSSLVPFTYLPFGDGPRYCIGMRYGKLQVKLGVAALVSQFKFSPSSQTPKHVVLDKLTKSPALTPKKGIFIKISKVTQDC